MYWLTAYSTVTRATLILSVRIRAGGSGVEMGQGSPLMVRNGLSDPEMIFQCDSLTREHKPRPSGLDANNVRVSAAKR